MKDYSKPNQEVIIERKQAIMLFSAGVLVMILVFALGVLFGKNLANRKLAKEKTELAKKAIFPEPAEPKPVPGTTSEIAQKIQEQKPPTALSGATVKPSAETQAPAQKPTPETQAQPPKPVAPEEWYAIQVASFPEKSSAEELIKQLKANKWETYMGEVEIAGKGTYYRVYVGRYSSKEQADKALLIFKSRETKFQDAYVTKPK